MVNGKVLTSMDPVTILPNDRIIIGGSSYFLYKNRAYEKMAKIPDTDENPITFDFADDEMLGNDEDQEAQFEMLHQEHQAMRRETIRELEHKLGEEEKDKVEQIEKLKVSMIDIVDID